MLLSMYCFEGGGHTEAGPWSRDSNLTTERTYRDISNLCRDKSTVNACRHAEWGLDPWTFSNGQGNRIVMRIRICWLNICTEIFQIFVEINQL